VSTGGWSWWAGIDWGSEHHQVCVIDASRRRVAEVRVEHSAKGLDEIVRVLTAATGGHLDQVAVAIEQPRGAIVETLLAHELAVFAINPKQIDRFRDRHSVGGAKDDRFDAFVGADGLRTDESLFRRVQLDPPKILALREWTRMHDELTTELGRLSNQLWEQLHRYYPQVLKLSSAVDEPWIWDLLARAPKPADAQRLRPKQVAVILKARRIRRIAADQVVARLREPALTVAPGAVEAASSHVRMLLPRLQLVEQQLRECRHQIDQVLDDLDEPPIAGGAPDDAAGGSPPPANEGEPGPATARPRPSDVAIVQSFPGAGRIVTATLLSEAAGPLMERDVGTLRTRCGAAPVTRKTGKQKRGRILMRRACNARLRDAVRHWSANYINNDERGRMHYDRLRAAGHEHERALRGIADRLLDVLIAMLRDGTTYDPTRRKAWTPKPKDDA